jgi:glycogen debranching enzyme
MRVRIPLRGFGCLNNQGGFLLAMKALSKLRIFQPAQGFMVEDGPHVPDLARLRPRPETLYVSQGRTVLATGRDGFIRPDSAQGLFIYETRLLSQYQYRLNNLLPQPVALSNISQASWLGYYLLQPAEATPPEMLQNAVELRLSRVIHGGLHEDIDITNYTQKRVELSLEIGINADFADLEEAQDGHHRQQKGRIETDWRSGGDDTGKLSWAYRAHHAYNHQGNKGTVALDRTVTLHLKEADSTPHYSGHQLSFSIGLAPQAVWHGCLAISASIDGREIAAPRGCRSFQVTPPSREMFTQEATRFVSRESGTLTPVVLKALEQGKQDLASLRLEDLDQGPGAWTLAAGLPMYVSLFGRDTLTAAWQAGLVSPAMMRGTLAELIRWQGKKTNDWRDEKPGRMLHEAHTGPLSILQYTPRQRYYGSATTSGFYPVVVSELWHWTGEKAAVQPLIEPALAALGCLDRYEDENDDGFYEYKTHSEQGVRHQGWKDSNDAIVDADGRQVEPPIAVCEEQAFAYLAKLHLSEVLWWFDRKDEAKRLYRQAEALKKRFNERFWLEQEGFFALGLDSKNQPIGSITSNPGHCVAAGIVDRSLARQTVQRLMAPDLFNGWGIRTLSSKNPAYNPYSYHRGSVWPVEQASFAMGFMRYGLHEEVNRLCKAQFEAASLFDYCRLPELFAGHQRDAEHPFPALYAEANSPQAWSSSAVFCMLQAILGLYPYAPLHMLLVDPHLPDWLPEITLENLHVGPATVDIRFFRHNTDSQYEILKHHGPLHVFRQPSPWSLTASFAERVKDILSSFLPRQ